jgi:hypothetical protein
VLNLLICLVMTTVDHHFSAYQQAGFLETKIISGFCIVHTRMICISSFCHSYSGLAECLPLRPFHLGTGFSSSNSTQQATKNANSLHIITYTT